MPQGIITAAYIAAAVLFVFSLAGLSKQETAKQGCYSGIAGMFLGIPGLLLGPLAGAAVGEYAARRCLLQAGKVGIGTFIGFIVGTAAKIGAALAITAVLLFRYLAYWLA